jgi:hypothetical protein
MQFVDFTSLSQNVVYTVQSTQYLYGSTGYMYIIKIVKPDNTIYYMIIREGSIEGNIYEKLETIRTGTLKKRFSFTKVLVSISPDVSAPFIIISGENDVVNLN